MSVYSIDYCERLPPTADIVIIGGGIIGAATAFFARRAGLRSVLLEKNGRLCSLTTPVATGAYRLQFDNPEEIALVRRSVDFFDRFNEETGLPPEFDIRLRPQGYLWLTRSEAGVERQRELVDRQHTWGLTDVELLGADEVEARYPYLVKGQIRSARFRQGDGFLDQKRLTMGLASASETRCVTGCEALGFTGGDGSVTGVVTSLGTIQAAAVVIAAGPFSGSVAGHAGIRLPIAPTIRQKLVMPEVPEVPPGAPMTIDDDTGAHWRPVYRGAFLIYTDPTTPESVPMDPVPVDPAYYDTLLDPRSPVNVGTLAPFWTRVWSRNNDHWFVTAGQYDYTPDRRPLLGASGVDNLLLNTGYSGHGVMASIGGSELVIGTLLGTVQPYANPFRPDRAMLPGHQDVL